MGKKKFLCLCIGLGLVVQFGVSFGEGLEKLKFGSMKFPVQHFLPVLAANENGFWKQNGLETEWVPFGSGGSLMRALAAKALNIGMSGSATAVQGAAAGIPVVIVGHVYMAEDWYVYVRTAGRFNKPKDLKGAVIGVGRFGSTEHAYGRMLVRALEIEKDVKFVATGGVRQTLALLKAGKIDANVFRLDAMAKLMISGHVKELIPLTDYRPKKWLDSVLYARKDFIRAKPSTVRAVMKTLLLSFDFIRANPRWAIEKLKEHRRLSEKAARLVYDNAVFTKDGIIDRKGLENLVRFLVEYGIIKRENLPPLDELYTNQFAGRG